MGNEQFHTENPLCDDNDVDDEFLDIEGTEYQQLHISTPICDDEDRSVAQLPIMVNGDRGAQQQNTQVII